MSVANELSRALPFLTVMTDPAELDCHRHDYWVLSHLDDLQERSAPPPACVVRPANVDHVVALVQWCSANRVAVVPFGLGSGVVGGVLARPDAIVLDMGAMNRVGAIDPENLRASFEAGVGGLAAEQAVARCGLTIGHWPQSIAVSTVGGWVATRSSGQFSTGYGNIEDIVYALDAVLPDGTVVSAGRTPRASSGPDLRQLLIGSEGTLGVITGVTLALRRAPEQQQVSAWHVPAMAAGFAAQREMVQSGWVPVVMRQYDAVESARSFPDEVRADQGLLVLVHEGPAGRVSAEKADLAKLAGRAGLEPAPESAVHHWLAHRNQVPHWNELLGKRIIVDTIEVAAPWRSIERLYAEAIAALRAVPDVINASAHSSHVYRTGINLYFSFAARPLHAEAMRDRYEACWRAVLESTLANEGGISHHHGIGRVRRAYLERELGHGGLALLRRIKHTIDPLGIMNPGVLL